MIMIAIRAARSPCRIVCLARTCYTVYNVQCKLQLDICAARSKITGLYPMTRAEARDSVELDRYGNSEVNMGGGVILPITAWSSRVQVTRMKLVWDVVRLVIRMAQVEYQRFPVALSKISCKCVNLGLPIEGRPRDEVRGWRG